MTMAFPSMQARPFPSLNTTTSPPLHNNNSSNTVKSPLGNGTGPWGSRTASIWGNGNVPNTLASRPSTADKSNHSKSSTIDTTQDATTKKGSGSLLASSESDSWSSRQFRPSLATQSLHSTEKVPQSNAISPVETRPPVINLTNPAFPHNRNAFNPPHLNTTFGSEPPAVYPKNKDRPCPGTYTPADSVVDYMSASASPTNERRPQWSSQYSNSTSVAASREASRPPLGPADRQYSFQSNASAAISPRYGQHGTASAHNNSISSVTELSSAFDSLNVRVNDRPSSSRSLPPGTRIIPDMQMSEINQSLLSNIDHLLPAHPVMSVQYGANSLQQQSMPFNLSTDRQASDPLSQFLPASTQQIGQPFRQYNTWQEQELSRTALSRRQTSVPDQQIYLDPRFAAQMLAMKTPYGNSFTGLTPASFAAFSHFQQYYPTGLGNVPPVLTAPEVERDLQSAKLFDFKMAGKNTRRYELRDIYEHIAEFAGDQHGSRFIQTKLETANSDEKERVFREIEPNAIPLMTDVFGNYVIQKFFDHGHQEHKRILANKMRGQVLALSTQMYGCRVVQKALEHVLLEQQAALVNELKHHVLKCVKDQNGNHVIQKVIERCSADSISFVYEAFIGQAHNLSLHPYGCRVIQRCLERTEWFPAKSVILAELHDSVPKGLIGDSYGNYVVQHIVQNGPEEDRRYVLGIILADVENFSKHKFASNVVEKCIEHSDDQWRRQVVQIFTKTDHRRPEHESILVGLIKDQYGNYVIQRLLDRLLMQDYVFFHHQLRPAMTHAKHSGSGKQVVSIEKKMQRFDFMPSMHEQSPPTTTSGGFANPYMPMNFNEASRPSNGYALSMLPSNNGDTVEGATSMSRNNSEAFSEQQSRLQ